MRPHYKIKRVPLETYKGYTIYEEQTIKVDILKIKSVESSYIGFTIKDGNYKLANHRYYKYVRDISSAKALIDEVENGEELLTEGEYYKWVTCPNKKRNYAINKTILKRIFNAYQVETSEKRKKAYLERLHDINFHTEAYLVENGDKDEFLKEINWMP